MTHTHTGDISVRRLTGDDIDAILESPETFALYLMTLTSQQLDTYIAELDSMKELDGDVRVTLKELFIHVKEEVLNYENEVAEKIVPLAMGIARAFAIQRQIIALEEIERSFS